MRALVAEDERTAQRLLQVYLQEFGECSLVEDGQAALGSYTTALDQGRPFDVIFLDIMMPGLNGHQVLARIRDIEADRGIPPSAGVKAVMTTALTDEENILEAHIQGCSAYCIKPFRRRDLREIMIALGFQPTKEADRSW